MTDIRALINDITEIKRIELSTGEPLAIVIKSDSMDQSDLSAMLETLRDSYDYLNLKTRVPVFLIGSDDDIDYITLSETLQKSK